MDKKKGLINISIAIIFKASLLVLDIAVRRFLIKYIGNDVNGLNSLYLSILDFLAVAELGVGSAITFCMYKPIVERDNDKVSALYGLFSKLYLIIGGVIFVAGCAIMPALPYLAKDYQNIDVNLYLTFGLMLISVVLTYMFSAKTSLINAYKNNYITTTIASGGRVLQCGLQMLVLAFTGSFVWYLVCRIISSILQWVATEITARIKHKDIIVNKQRIDTETKKEVTKNVRAMFMHKIGGILVNTADSLIISAFIGIAVLGKYSNYTSIAIAVQSILILCFTPLTSVIGHMYAEDGGEVTARYCNFFHTFNFILGMVFFLGYYAIADNLVTIFFGNNLELSKSISIVITINYFIQFLRQATGTFRDATGTFYNDRWKPIGEGIVNVALSILFVKVFPEEYNVVGVIVATVITNIFICHVIEPLVLYKYAFKISPKKYYIKNYLYMVIFVAALGALHFAMVSMENQWLELVANGFISVGISLGVCIIVGLCSKDFRHYVKQIFGKIKRRKHIAVAENGDIDVDASNEVDSCNVDNNSINTANSIEEIETQGCTVQTVENTDNDRTDDG